MSVACTARPRTPRAAVVEAVSVAVGQRMHEAATTVASSRGCVVAEALAAAEGGR